jgi:3-deoxy-7-phosphoheptulonate synthase
MIIVFRRDATEEQIQGAIAHIERLGYKPHLSRGAVKTICGVTGDDRSLSEGEFDQLPGVESILRVLKPYKLASREFHPEDTRITLKGVAVGQGTFAVIAGPCSVESEEQVDACCAAVRSNRAPRRTPSRAWARRACASSRKRPVATAWRW